MFELELGSVDRWELGNLELWIHRVASEWRLGHAWDDSVDREGWRREPAEDLPELTADGRKIVAERFAVRQTGGIVRLTARTPDRSVVARPRTPLRVPSGHEARIYVSSPLWVEIAVGEATTLLRELPIRRLSNTWFGPSTREGELAYALKTSGRTSVEDLPHRPYRFVTPVVIDNQASDTLVVERLNLPVPNLSLFGAVDSLWSESVRMLRRESGDMAELDVRPGPPKEADGAESLGGSREPAGRGHLFRAFSSILRLSGAES